MKNIGNLIILMGVLILVGLGVIAYNSPDHNKKLVEIQKEYKERLAK